MSDNLFQPFTDRLSRDIRNDLSESLVTAIKEDSLGPAENIGNQYLRKNLDPAYSSYIQKRLQCYARALKTLRGHTSDPLFQALVLWDEELFFEVHEVLEHAWLQADGEEKLFLQAMIRAAGVYVKIEAGYTAPAAKIAAKAIPVLKNNWNRLEQYTTPTKLIEALENLEVESPKLLEGE